MTREQLIELSEKVMGSREAADEWLHSEAMALSYKRPIDMLSSEEGRGDVETLLKKLDAGVYI